MIVLSKFEYSSGRRSKFHHLHRTCVFCSHPSARIEGGKITHDDWFSIRRLRITTFVHFLRSNRENVLVILLTHLPFVLFLLVLHLLFDPWRHVADDIRKMRQFGKPPTFVHRVHARLQWLHRLRWMIVIVQRTVAFDVSPNESFKSWPVVDIRVKESCT